MNRRQFEDLLNDSYATILQLNRSKGGEYSGDADALSNFKRNGAEAGIHPITCWRIYAGKHWDSISTYVRDVSQGNPRVYSEPIEGRIDDLILYLFLLKGLVIEGKRAQLPPEFSSRVNIGGVAGVDTTVVPQRPKYPNER